MIRSAWFPTTARAGLAVVWLIAGTAKVGDLSASGRTVNAYRILPSEAAMAFGAVLPFIELALGVLLLLGLGTRLVAGISAVLLIGFLTGIAWVWAHGYRIDCGCFSGGGDLAADERPTYLLDLLRDGSFLLLAGFLAARPTGRLAIDNWLRAAPVATDRTGFS